MYLFPCSVPTSDYCLSNTRVSGHARTILYKLVHIPVSVKVDVYQAVRFLDVLVHEPWDVYQWWLRLKSHKQTNSQFVKAAENITYGLTM